eukprot:gene37683-45779_t
MDRATFEKELAKYAIVRDEDYCKPRSKNNLISIKPSPRPVPLGESNKKKILVDESGSGEVSFWTLMEKVGADILTPEENEKFMSAMKKTYGDVNELINLEDLNNAAQLVNAKC